MRILILSDAVGKPFSVGPAADDDLLQLMVINEYVTGNLFFQKCHFKIFFKFNFKIFSIKVIKYAKTTQIPVTFINYL